MPMFRSDRIRGLLLLSLLVVYLLFASPPMAWALGDTTTVDVSPVLPWLNMLLQNGFDLALAVIGGLAARYIRNEALRRALVDAIERAAAGAYAEIHAAGATYADVPIRNAAVANAVNYIIPRFKLAMAVFGLTPDSVGEMIHKQLGATLVSDPTVSIAAPAAVAPAPAAPQPPLAAAA